MRSAPTFLVLLAAATSGCLSGCICDPCHLGPPPPAYACGDYGAYGYGYGAAWGLGDYGGFGECVDDTQQFTRRDRRRMRRDARLGRRGWPSGHRGQTLNGLPVVAAYIVPMDAMGNMMGNSCGMGGGWECGAGMCGDGFCCEGVPCGEGMPCGDCGPCGSTMSGDPGVYPGGMVYPEGEMGWQPVPSEAYPPSYLQNPGQYEGEMITPVPVPPAGEGPWNPPGTTDPSRPLTTPEPEARLPIQGASWRPTRLP